MDLQSYHSASNRVHDMGLLLASMYDDSQFTITFVVEYVREELADEGGIAWAFPGRTVKLHSSAKSRASATEELFMTTPV